MHQTWRTQDDQHRTQSIQPSDMHTVGVHHVCRDIWRHVSYGSLFWLKVSGTMNGIFYYCISTNVNCYQTRRWWQCCVQQNSSLAHHACNTVKLQDSKLSTSFLLITAFDLTAQQWSPLIMRVRDPHISMSISCESIRLKKSSSDWLKSRSIRVKNAIFVFFCFTR